MDNDDDDEQEYQQQQPMEVHEEEIYVEAPTASPPPDVYAWMILSDTHLRNALPSKVVDAAEEYMIYYLEVPLYEVSNTTQQ